MTDDQWDVLQRVLRGERVRPLPAGLIIDCPWLPGWAGVSILDYLSNGAWWFDANLRVVKRFPDLLFLPGFWSEYGMCTEPSAFGGKCVWFEDSFPSIEKVIHEYGDVQRLKKPDSRTDGLLPFVVKRLAHYRKDIERAGHQIRFAVARGPLNIASYLVGHTEFLIGLKTNPDEMHQLLRIITDFLVDWIGLQAATFDTIDGVLLLDDLIGFLGENDFREFALPYLKAVYDSVDCSVKALHNDAHGLMTAKYLKQLGVNLFNFSFEHSYQEIWDRAGREVTLLGNIPPRDVLANGSPEDVARSVHETLDAVDDPRYVVLSAGGGAPPGVSEANIEAMCRAAWERA